MDDELADACHHSDHDQGEALSEVSHILVWLAATLINNVKRSWGGA